jgi:pyruvate-formate lyase-activating enzyme
MSTYKLYPGNEIFPVKSQTGCLLKWSWSTINIETSTTSSCHRTRPGKIDPDNFGNFHNIPEKIRAREDMLAGQWPGNGCEYCQKVEDHGGISDRKMTLMRHHGADKIPPELFEDPNATSVTPTILEVYFNNTCNLSCVYCIPNLSSKWNDEIRKFGPIDLPGFKLEKFTANNDRYHKMVSDLWKYLAEKDRYKIIRQFQVLGGEPLLQKELDQTISFWQSHPNDSLTINLISNLMLPHQQFVEKISKFEQLVKSNAIYILEITASLDCWGREQEYARTGLDLDIWEKNFEYLLDKPWINLSIHSCINVLSIKTLPDLITKIVNWNKLRPDSKYIEHSFDFVLAGQQNGLHPTTFGPGVFDNDFEKVIDLMPTETGNQLSAKQHMQGLARLVKNTPKNLEKIDTLISYLDELDRRRNADWRTVFPWITKLLSKSKVY